MIGAVTTHTVDLPQGKVVCHESGQGEPIVFLHGLLMAGSLWFDVMSRVGDGFRCIAPDLPLGAHTIALREHADNSPAGVARLVADLLEALQLDSVTLVGNDTGGAIAQLVATRNPQRIGRLVLTNCDAYENFLPLWFRYLQVAARLPLVADLAFQSMRIRPLRRTPVSFGWLSKGQLDDELLDSWIQPALHDGGVRRDLRKFLRGIRSSDTIGAARALRSFERPALIAWAPEDRYFNIRYGERLAAEIPDARLERIEDSRTLVALDQPDRVAELVREFAGAAGDTA
jgi:pimeloyl-ACP methyl ester carboxylesterase